MKYYLIGIKLVFLIFLIFFQISCRNNENEIVFVNAMNSSQTTSLISGDTPQKWKVNIYNLKANGQFNTLFFVDENNGWAGGNSGFYKTSDSGLTWNKIGINLPTDREIVQIYFNNLMNGWIVVQSNTSDTSLSTENDFQILNTKDGGKSWQTQHIEKGGVITDLKMSIRQGWITGLKHEKDSPVCFSPLLLNYDQDKWVRDESFVKNILETRDVRDERCVNKALMGIAVSENNKTRIITNEKVIYEKDINSWHQVMNFKTVDAQSGIKTFGMTDSQKFWFLEGTGSIEGVRGRLTVGSPKDSSENYTKMGLFFMSAVNVSEKEFIIGGAKIDYDLSKKTDNYVKRSLGAILWTKDEGKTFEEILEVPEEEKIVFVTKINGVFNKVWALGEKGTIIQLIRNDLKQ